jgi:hypothetical protein
MRLKRTEYLAQRELEILIDLAIAEHHHSVDNPMATELLPHRGILDIPRSETTDGLAEGQIG